MIPTRPFVLAFLASAALLPAQGGKPAAPDPEVAAKLEQLKEVVADRKMARDAEGIDIITVLVKKWQGSRRAAMSAWSWRRARRQRSLSRVSRPWKQSVLSAGHGSQR